MRLVTAFHPLPPSDRLAGSVRDRATALQESHEGVVGCHVSVTAPDHEEISPFDTGRWKVELLLTLKDRRGMRRGPRQRAEDRDVYAALNDAFDSAEERLDR